METKKFCGMYSVGGPLLSDESLAVTLPTHLLSGVYLDFAVAVALKKFSGVMLVYKPHIQGAEVTQVQDRGAFMPYRAIDDSELVQSLLGDEPTKKTGQQLRGDAEVIASLRNFVAENLGGHVDIPIPTRQHVKLFRP